MLLRLLLILGSLFLTTAPAVAENVTPKIDQEGAIVIPSFLTDDHISTIDTPYNGGWEYYVGGGAAAFDCNDDHYPDLYLAGGETQAGLYINQSQRGGALIFAKSKHANLQISKVIGTYPIDIDSDGIIDLMTLRHGENILFRGLGNCQFERANEAWNFDGGDEWSTSFSATWEDNKDGGEQKWPTIAIGNYVDQNAEGTPWGTCSDNKLFRPNQNDNGFGKPQNLKAYCTLSLLFTDWNRSSSASLRVSNDRQYNKNGREQLWRLPTNSEALEYTKKDGFKKLNIWGMGIASHDVNGDGYPDYFLTSMGDNKLRLSQIENNKPIYKDQAFKLGITAHRPWDESSVLPSTGWHAQFADLNNDSDIDLFIAKGNVEQMQDFALNDPNNLLLGKPDGSFFEAAGQAGLLSTGRSRGALVVDFNLDGLLDIYEVNREAAPGVGIWRNLGKNNNNIISGRDDVAQSQKQRSLPTGNWLGLTMNHTNYNKNAIGGWIEVKTSAKVQFKEITLGGGHASAMMAPHHFGIGIAQKAQVRITWPDSTKSNWIEVKANQFATIHRQNSAVTLWSPSNTAKLLQ